MQSYHWFRDNFEHSEEDVDLALTFPVSCGKSHWIEPNFLNKSSPEYSHWLGSRRAIKCTTNFLNSTDWVIFLISSISLIELPENIRQIRDSWSFLHFAYLCMEVLRRKEMKKMWIVPSRVFGFSKNKEHHIWITLKRLPGSRAGEFCKRNWEVVF